MTFKDFYEAKFTMKGSGYYYQDPNGVVRAVGDKKSMQKMNIKQAKAGNKGGSFSQNFKKYKVGDKIKEEVELDEAMDTWKVTVVKPVNKLKKGQSVSVKANNVSQALKKSAKAFGDSNLVAVPSTHFDVQKEEVELDEKYDLYHKDFSGAMKHAYDYAKKKLGITVDPKEIDSKVATGPKKPSEGKTNKYRLKGKGGNLQIQVYNKGGSKPFELNMYKEEVEIDEAMGASAHRMKMLDKMGLTKPKSRQLKNKDTEMLVTIPHKKGGVKTIDKKDWPKFKKQGYIQAESTEVNERNYRKEYDNYHSRPEQIANRSSRNSARRIMGDKAVKGKDVGHKDNNPLNNDPKNLQMEDPSENRREPRLRDEASKEGTIKIIKTKDNKFQVQRMTKGKFVNQGKPYKSLKDAEKVRSSGQHSMQFSHVEEKATDKRMRSWHKDYDFDQDRDIVKGFVSPRAKNLAKKMVKDAVPMVKATKMIRSKFPGMKLGAISDLLKKEGLPQAIKAKDSARRKEYNAFQKARRK